METPRHDSVDIVKYLGCFTTGGHKSVESLSVNFFNKLCLMKFIGWENILYLVWVSLSNCMFVLSYYNGIEKDS